MKCCECMISRGGKNNAFRVTGPHAGRDNAKNPSTDLKSANLKFSTDSYLTHQSYFSAKVCKMTVYGIYGK